ncbi:MlaD family protein [Mucilaginibacter sp. UYCu711]|jgi:phospholipid/cholesterol/gamma-HCH transport system substrate-binding protein|uniref:MlaD family protein n=1 Tax=Mucilaginibacter sp. UYCu711 TaxID=3156339 RepID=UPI003D1ECFA8
MAEQKENNIKLGVFVLAGLFVLILTFYIIGKNNNLFGANFKLKARFTNLNGLTVGSNVMFSGIQAGTVKSTDLINDTTLEVTMQINSKVKTYIHKNALAGIGTEGLMGNKIVNITPVGGPSAVVEDGDLLRAQKMVNMDEIITTLSKTNNNVASISEVLKSTVLRIDSSDILKLLNDKSIGASLKSSLQNIYKATNNANQMIGGLNIMVKQIKSGKGTAGLLLTDTAMAANLKETMVKIKTAGTNANNMTIQLNEIVKQLNHDLTNGKGPVHTLLTDSVMANNLSKSIDNLQKGTDGFNQNMEALKHNFFFKGYFKDQAKQKKKDEAKDLLIDK